MKTCMLNPAADVTVQWTASSGMDHSALVRDGSDATDVNCNLTGAVEEWRLGAVPANFGTSTAVRVKIRARAAVGGFSRSVQAALRVGGAEMGTAALVVSGGEWADYTVTAGGWNTPKWELDWNSAATSVRLTMGDGAVRVYVSEVRVEVDYLRLALLRPAGDAGTQGWTAVPGPEHWAMVDEGTAVHDGAATRVTAQSDGVTDQWSLGEVPVDFGRSRRVEVRCAAATVGDDQVTVQPVVGGVGQGEAVVGQIGTAYGLHRVEHTNWQERGWSRAEMNGALLRMTYDLMGKSAYVVAVSAVELAVSFESRTVRGSVVRPALIEVTE